MSETGSDPPPARDARVHLNLMLEEGGGGGAGESSIRYRSSGAGVSEIPDAAN